MSPLPSHLNVLRVLQEAEADGLQGLLRPLMEPVDGCAVHDGGELPAADSQLGPHRGETESHLRRQKGGENQEGIQDVLTERQTWPWILYFPGNWEAYQQRQKSVNARQPFQPRD